jgi:hypothetical protein
MLPVDVEAFERGARCRRGMPKNEVPSLFEPLVDAAASPHRHAPMIGYDYDIGRFVRRRQQQADSLVHERVVLVSEVFETVSRNELGMCRIEMLPVRVVQSIGPDLVDREDVPALSRVEQRPDAEALSGHVEEAVGEPIALLGPEDHVELVGAELSFELLLELGRVCGVAAAGRGEEVRDAQSIELERRVPSRHAHGSHPVAPIRQDLPDSGDQEIPGGRGVHVVVRFRSPMPEPVQAEGPRIRPGEHHGPRGDRDRRVGGPERSTETVLEQASDVGHHRQEAVEEELWGNPIKTDDEQPTTVPGWPVHGVHLLGTGLPYSLVRAARGTYPAIPRRPM